jgi:hypothetical protein
MEFLDINGEIIMQLPIQSQPVLRNVSTASNPVTGIMASRHWNCYSYTDPFLVHAVFQGTVDTPWSDETGAGVWACNNWISNCGNAPFGGCEAY